eukprot:3363935-Prymnesium_polylepis.2
MRDVRLLIDGLVDNHPQLIWHFEVRVAAEQLHARRRPEERLSGECVIASNAIDHICLAAALAQHVTQAGPQLCVESQVDVKDARDALLEARERLGVLNKEAHHRKDRVLVREIDFIQRALVAALHVRRLVLGNLFLELLRCSGQSRRRRRTGVRIDPQGQQRLEFLLLPHREADEQPDTAMKGCAASLEKLNLLSRTSLGRGEVRALIVTGHGAAHVTATAVLIRV